jgi:carbon monoxide dehydrogenase subunit G
MKEGNFELEIHIERQPKEVVALVSNYNLHTKIHPLILSVKQIDAPAGVIGRYLITDQLQIGPLKFKIEYRADIVRVTEDEIYTEAYQAPGTHINNLTRVTPEAGGARLKETVTLRAPDLLFGYAFNQARSAHTEMLGRIKQFMEK